ncbi:hypothetical protein [Mesobacillus foraminis]|uniref:TrbC/VIRB2 family protein n=1 Tax=Mesobacillus foraminis TaxID=279826 RepID=A0A4R2BG44_9BACI|nr:hypothetical protein [Mesobacillus foraminis]TCN25465.1 hypothetical protein EV146_105122 [Mesobacillus foraminis]
MFKRNKEQVYSIKEFMSGNKSLTVEVEKNGFEFKEEVRESLGVLGALSVIPLTTKQFFSSTPVFAAENAIPVVAPTDVMYDKMLHAFDPLITMIQALSYPVAMVVCLGGAIMVMIGRDKGWDMMQGAGLGYVLVQILPLVLNILVDAMKAV